MNIKKYCPNFPLSFLALQLLFDPYFIRISTVYIIQVMYMLLRNGRWLKHLVWVQKYNRSIQISYQAVMLIRNMNYPEIAGWLLSACVFTSASPTWNYASQVWWTSIEDLKCRIRGLKSNFLRPCTHQVIHLSNISNSGATISCNCEQNEMKWNDLIWINVMRY